MPDANLIYYGELLLAIPIAVVLRRILLITLLALPQRFWLGRGWQIAAGTRYPWLRRAARAILVVAAIAIVAVLYDRIFQKFLPGAVGRWISPIVQLWIFTSTFAFFCVQAVYAIGWLWSKIARLRASAREPGANDQTRRAFVRYAAYIVGSAPFIPAVYGFASERLNFEVVRVDAPIPNLPAALDGFRIVQFSDIHAGDFMPREEIRRAVKMANDLAPHLAVITGDLITGRGDPLADCISELSRLNAPLGVWGCNGNHEIYAEAERAAETLFATHGMKLLRHASAKLSWNGESLNLIGVDYQRNVHLTGSMLPRLAGVESLVRSGMPNILLSHNPNTFYRAADLGIELTLAGHTHGGQIKIEIVNHSWSPARFLTNFVAGIYHLPMAQRTSDPGMDSTSPRATLYVNRGLGTLGIPARLGAAPEITLLTLRSEAARQ